MRSRVRHRRTVSARTSSMFCKPLEIPTPIASVARSELPSSLRAPRTPWTCCGRRHMPPSDCAAGQRQVEEARGSRAPGAPSSKTQARGRTVRPRATRKAHRSASHRRAVHFGCAAGSRAADSSRLPACQPYQKRRGMYGGHWEPLLTGTCKAKAPKLSGSEALRERGQKAQHSAFFSSRMHPRGLAEGRHRQAGSASWRPARGPMQTPGE